MATLDLATTLPPVADTDVDAERDRRTNAGVMFAGIQYQTRPEDRENIAGKAILAAVAIMQGAQPGDLRWNGGDRDFGWIAEDNSITPMDAQTMFAFAKAAADRTEALIFAGRQLKEQAPVPLDYRSDRWWS